MFSTGINQIYMAGLMAAPMGIFELVLMGRMYPNKRRNTIVVALCLLVGVFCWFGIRRQIGIRDIQFIRSMVPHHAGAILMCHEAELSDPELKELCASISESQAAEIAQMKGILARLTRAEHVQPESTGP